MDILKSGRLIWSIYDASLDDGDVTLSGHPVTPADLDRLNQPIRLTTPDLILRLEPIKFANVLEAVEFPTGPVVTPLQILGAIYTYYNQPLTEEELNRTETLGGRAVEGIINRARENIHQGKTVPRRWIMEDDIFIKGLQDGYNGSFVVELGS